MVITVIENRAEILFYTNLFQIDYTTKSLAELKSIGAEINFSVTADDIAYMEAMTKNQAGTDYWRRFRIGRITGSTFKKVCRTSIVIPAITTVKSICCPTESTKFIPSIEYGKKYASTALNTLTAILKKEHAHFKIERSGLQINDQTPFFVSSPDEISSCDCCGERVVEVKCPNSLRSGGGMNTICSLKFEILKTTYYQVQMELFTTKLKDAIFSVF